MILLYDMHIGYYCCVYIGRRKSSGWQLQNKTHASVYGISLNTQGLLCLRYDGVCMHWYTTFICTILIIALTI